MDLSMLILLLMLVITIILDYKTSKDTMKLVEDMLNQCEKLTFENIKHIKKETIIKDILKSSEKTIENPTVTLGKIKEVIKSDN